MISDRPRKSCELSSSGKLKCPQNCVIHNNSRINRNACIKFSCCMIEYSHLECLPSIHSSPSSYLKYLFSNHNSPFSTLLFPSSVKRTGYLVPKVLKIVRFLTKCPQAPLALLVAFSRSDRATH